LFAFHEIFNVDDAARLQIYLASALDKYPKLFFSRWDVQRPMLR
jgi:hypothetical protein